MVEQRKKQMKTKRRDKNRGAMHEVTKEEYAVAKYVRFNCPTKTATIIGNEMHYFTASKAIDCLIASKKWGQNADEKTRLFPNRQTCMFYMQTLLDKGLLFRAKKLVPKRKDRDAIGTDAAGAATSSADKTAALLRKDSKTTKNADEKETAQQQKSGGATAKKLSSSKTKKSAAVASAESSGTVAPAHSSESNNKSVTTKDKEKESKEKEKEKDGSGGKKKSKKIKFEVHQIQEFNDSNDIYVWKYDPTSTKMFFLGLAMVLGSIGVCLFPLWPPEVRLGVYYLSVAAMIFVGFIVVLVILRCILFGVIWCVTMGKHHFWLLPHLTDDCGFFDSFKPLYSHIVMDKTGSDGGGTDKKDSAGTGKDSAAAGTEKDGSTADADKKNRRGSDVEDEDDDDNSGAEQDDKNSDDDDEEGNGDENADGCKNSDFSPSESEQSLTDEDGSIPAESADDRGTATVPQKDRLKRKKDQ